MPNELRQTPWQPTYIDIEKEFTNFVRNFRDGKIVSELKPDIPDGVLNADFYFQRDGVIAELKCLVEDPAEPITRAMRIAASGRHFGYTGSDFFGWLWRGEPIPEKVLRRVESAEKRSISDAIRKANKQIRSTKKLLNCKAAKGLVLLANDRNMGFNLSKITSIISIICLSIDDCHVDGVVYFCGNAFHDNGDRIAYQPWSPVYKPGSENLSYFVDELGSFWLDYHDKLMPEPALIREKGDNLFDKYALSQPIPALKRP